MFDPDTIQFSNPVLSYDEFIASDQVKLSEALEPLVNGVQHIACGVFRLLASPFQQTLQLTAYEFYSAFRNTELLFGVLLAVFKQPYGEYLMYVAKTNIDQYNAFLDSFHESRETYKLLSQRLF